MKKLILALAILGLTGTAYAQEQASGNSAIEYDVDSSSTTYCRVEGLNGNVFGPNIPNNFQIKTTGSTTTVDAATGTPFDLLLAGDVIFVTRIDGTTDRRVIITRSSSSQVVVNAAVDWSAASAPNATGFAFSWRKTRCGTAATDGWFPASAQAATSIHIQYDQGDLTALLARVECRASYIAALPIQVFPACTAGACNTTQSYATVGITSRSTYVVVDPSYTECRVGIAWSGADASDAGANLESVTVGITRSTVFSR